MGAAFGLLGFFLNPGFYLIGAGVTAACVGLVAGNARFRNTIDAADPRSRPRSAGPAAGTIGRPEQGSPDQASKSNANSCSACSETANAGSEHIQGVWQLAQLHLRLLVARARPPMPSSAMKRARTASN